MFELLSVDRRQFRLRSAMAILGGATITVSRVCEGDTFGVISDNHGHQASITSAQLAAGSGLLLNIRGDADHAHRVELTACDLLLIRGQQTVVKECSPQGAHTHRVCFSRGADSAGPGY